MLSPSLCPPYSASDTASATKNYLTCVLNLCGGDTAIMSMCQNGGSFTGGTPYLVNFHADDLYCRMFNVIVSCDDNEERNNFDDNS